MDGFKIKYNEHGLKQIFKKQPDDLLNDESKLNKEYNKYKENMDKILITSKSFNKYIEDIGGIMKKLSTPDTQQYKSWDIDQIILWIKGLEQGRFMKHINKLRNGFIKCEITGKDLPDLTRTDLSSAPFEIGHFSDRKQLEMYFKYLPGSNKPQIPFVAMENDGMENNEGAPTAYI